MKSQYYGYLNKTFLMITPVDMLTWKGEFHDAPALDEELKAANIY